MTPNSAACSSTRTRKPLRASASAVAMPPRPPPTTRIGLDVDDKASSALVSAGAHYDIHCAMRGANKQAPGLGPGPAVDCNAQSTRIASVEVRVVALKPIADVGISTPGIGPLALLADAIGHIGHDAIG